MSEFCAECHLKDTPEDAGKLVLSEDRDLCEGCGEWKQVVVKVK